MIRIPISFLLLVLACARGALAQIDVCTQTTVVGKYAVASRFMPAGLRGNSMALGRVSLAIVSVAVDGTISGRMYSSTDGEISESETSGSIKILGDCTGTVDWGGVIADTVVLEDGRELRSVHASADALGSVVASAAWKRISKEPGVSDSSQCSPKAISGTYLYRSSGLMLMGAPETSVTQAVPAAMLGLGSTHDDSRASGKVTASLGGRMMPLDLEEAEDIAVQPDCTAFIRWHLYSNGIAVGESQQFSVVLDAGDEIWAIQIQNGLGRPVLLDTWSRVSEPGVEQENGR